MSGTRIALAGLVLSDTLQPIIYLLDAKLLDVKIHQLASMTHTDPSRTGDDPIGGPGPGSTTRTPRWVKVSVVIAIVLVLLFVILHFAGLSPITSHTP